MRFEMGRVCKLVSSGARWIMYICEMVTNNALRTGRACGKVESNMHPI